MYRIDRISIISIILRSTPDIQLLNLLQLKLNICDNTGCVTMSCKPAGVCSSTLITRPGQECCPEQALSVEFQSLGKLDSYPGKGLISQHSTLLFFCEGWPLGCARFGWVRRFAAWKGRSSLALRDHCPRLCRSNKPCTAAPSPTPAPSRAPSAAALPTPRPTAGLCPDEMVFGLDCATLVRAARRPTIALCSGAAL